MTKKELKKLEEELQRHGYKSHPHFLWEYCTVWEKWVESNGERVLLECYTRDFTYLNAPCNADVSASFSMEKNNFKVRIAISSRTNMDLLQLEGTVYSVLNLLKP